MGDAGISPSNAAQSKITFHYKLSSMKITDQGVTRTKTLQGHFTQ